MDLTIEPLSFEHCAILADAFAQQSWRKPEQQYRQYVIEQNAGERDCWVALVEGQVAGYVTVKWASPYAPFYEQGVPEIMDLNVLKRFQQQGIATQLLDHAESVVARTHEVVGIGVGLIADYGPAQALYCRRGYIPDKRGISVAGVFLTYGDSVVMGDDVALYFTKPLSS
ncbi:GNAT family N-acetyltransferase [Reinekea blandensis]|uniref:N-acetyltransferase domain-containing protein n=1 Tax=Reinekea blandensis MED297 TaxID=314283 RepID=A4BFZ2_9GAMM|nr:GNAT family N-acetyltransferase [Reinekea blandensis]EAR09010.1 hypothetical protein MED297_03937 [Reinekea sp. MED297] [Reinekea blandensis MED297]